jgi:hypothetical protein
MAILRDLSGLQDGREQVVLEPAVRESLFPVSYSLLVWSLALVAPEIGIQSRGQDSECAVDWGVSGPFWMAQHQWYSLDSGRTVAWDLTELWVLWCYPWMVQHQWYRPNLECAVVLGMWEARALWR